MQTSKAEVVEGLRARIAALENRPLLAGRGSASNEALSPAALATAPGLLHEIFTPERRNSGVAFGFGLALAQNLLRPDRPAVLFVQLSQEASELGLPFGGGLAAFGFDPDSLVLIRTANIVEFLWAMEEAIGCRAVAAVIGEVARTPKLLDFTASRRLSLRAQEAGTSALLLRYGREREASAATFRWQVLPGESAEKPYDARAPGEVRWRVSLEKGLLGGTPGQQHWLLGWTEHGLVELEHGRGAGTLDAAAPAAYGAGPAPLGDRLPQTA